jgi:hypothetical protein
MRLYCSRFKAMKRSWYPYSRRPRSRLRKRKNNPYRFGFYRFNKYYCNTENKNECYDRDRILVSGFTVGEAWGCLEKAWVGFRAAKRLDNDKDMKLYASVIQRLEKELKIEVNDFPELGLCACGLEEDAREEKDEEEDEDDYVQIDFGSL